MLSRVAENIYWMARYIERIEDTARLINVNTNLLLDLPRPTAFGWEPLLYIVGTEAKFYERGSNPNEVNIIKYMIADQDNSSSILTAIMYARENLRTTRDVVPREAWEQINDLYLYIQGHLEMGVSQRGRYEFLKNVIRSTQQITGLLAGTMTHNAAYNFVRIGRNLERADMTTRILDVRSANLLVGQLQPQMQTQSQEQGLQSQEQNQEAGQQSQIQDQELDPFENIQWMSVLKTLSAYQMYRQQVRLRVRGPDVLKFILQDPLFPRSVYHCLSELQRSLDGLPETTAIATSIGQLKQNLIDAEVPELALTREGLHHFIDQLQIGLGEIHGQVEATYFPRQQ